MENKKTIVILSVLVAIFGLGFVGMTFYSMGIKKGQESSAGVKTVAPDPTSGIISGQNNETNTQQPIYIAEKEKQPEVMTGKIESLDDAKLVLKQIASIDLSYEIKKEDIGEVIFMEKNSEFNQEKASNAQEEMMKLLPSAATTPPPPNQVNGNSNTPPPTLTKEVSEKMRAMNEDPEIRPFNEVKKDWSSLKEGLQINVMVQEGKRKITVYPDDFLSVPGEMEPTQE